MWGIKTYQRGVYNYLWLFDDDGKFIGALTPEGQKILKNASKVKEGTFALEVDTLEVIDAKKLAKSPDISKIRYLSRFYDMLSDIFGVGAPLIDTFNEFNQFIWKYLARLQISGSYIADIGCGSGYYSRMLTQLGATVVSVDISEKRLSQSPILKESTYVVAAAENMPFADNVFDIVLCIFVLEHVIDVEAVIREMLRITKYGGHLLIAIPSISLNYIVSQVGRKYLDIAHLRVFGICEWIAPWCMSTIKLIKMIKRYGGKIESVEAVGVLGRNNKLVEYINKFIASRFLFKYLGAQTIIYVKKYKR